ncbi:glycosyltransferase [Marinilactibacillus sp. XAAS-LB27]|uniref:glycosyltransferase family 2 protein n=1 Tax=Marinilactibacillus sp. XAAS-LB27 TaxID=3114538 RepID=UPI002E1931F0|nr:glycosyltransferase [Marinilactibacillus sp. XAAS-LB27]
MRPSNPLVSIMTPCFNGEKFIQKFLESVLSQTYDNIQLVIVDDGSTDRTKEVILSNSEKFKSKGILLDYVYQENAGQAAAINKGLSLARGKYLTWPDSDDYFSEDSIEKRVAILEENENYDFVLNKTHLVNSDKNLLEELIRPEGTNRNLFDDMIFEKNAIFHGGAYLVRRDVLMCKLKDGKIFESRAGQNWQLILPVAYQNKIKYLDEPLFFVYVREGSHSRGERSFSSEIKKAENHEIILNEVIDSINEIPDEDKKNYKKKIHLKYLRKKLKISSEFEQKKERNVYYSDLKKVDTLTLKDHMLFLEGSNKLTRKFVKIFRKVRYS